MNRTIFVLLLTFSAFPGYPAAAQDQLKRDSLRNEIKKSKGTAQISLQLELTSLLLNKDQVEAENVAKAALQQAKTLNALPQVSRAYFLLGRISQVMNKKNAAGARLDSALTIAKVLKDSGSEGEILFYMGVNQLRSGEENRSLKYLNESVQASRLVNNYKTMASAYSMMGTIFRINGMYDRAIEYVINAKLNYQKANFPEGDIWGTYLLGRIYSELKSPQKALENFEEALRYYTKMAELDHIQDGVAICYEEIGLLHMESGNLEEASKYIDYTLKIFESDKSAYGMASARKNLGVIEYKKGNYQLALDYLQKSLKVKKEFGDQLSLPSFYEYIGLSLIGLGRNQEGLKNLKEGLQLAIKNNQKKKQFDICGELSNFYLRNHHLAEAIACQKEQIKIQDKILSGDANIKIEQLQTIYEIDKKNLQIIELEKQNEINALKIQQHRTSLQIMILGILIAVLFSAVIYWLYNKIRIKNRELNQSNAAKDKFFAIIAHDLRGPTSTLSAFLEHLHETSHDHTPEELKKILSMLHKSAENVSALLENLLMWAKSQLNKLEFNPTEFRLSEIVGHSAAGFSQMAANKEIRIDYLLDDQLFVYADAEMVQTIIRNLLSNAIKFTPRGGMVNIRTNAGEPGMAVFTIKDNGVGMDEIALSCMYDITRAVHTKGTEEENSSGFGLILVREFVAKNGGTMNISSCREKGTDVSFTLPLAPKQQVDPISGHFNPMVN